MVMNTYFIKKFNKEKKKLLGKDFYEEHFKAAVEIIKIMASDKPNTNHIILDAPTQSGKTSVMEMVYKLLNFDDLYEKFGITNVIYMTADNGSGKGALKFQTKDRFENHWKNYIHNLPIEFLKGSDFDKYVHAAHNTLVMVDESQYGWREITSRGQKFLQLNGVNFCSADELQKMNTYILSVSATTQNERYGDSELKLKPIVKLETGKGYIGFEDFFDMGCIKPVTDDNFINTYEKLDNFLGLQSKKLKNIYKETGISKCVILRLYDNKKNGFYTDSEEFAYIASNNGFTLDVITCKESKIDYSQIEMSIFYNCNHYKENGMKFHLVVIKNAFSYGITIKSETKKLISTCYDVRKDTNSTEATEQGLLGRMSGYGCKKSDFNDFEIYINETHYNGIKECKINLTNEYSTPLKAFEKSVRVKCERKDWDGNKKNIVVWNNKDKQPLVFEGKIVDDFCKKHSVEYDFKTLFQKEKIINTGNKDSVIGKIVKGFLKETGVWDKYGFTKNNVFELRRKTSVNDRYADRICTRDPIVNSLSRTSWCVEENAQKGEIAWGGLIDITKANEKTLKGIIIKIPYGHIGFAKTEAKSSFKNKKRKLYSGYDTSINKTKITDVVYV